MLAQSGFYAPPGISNVAQAIHQVFLQAMPQQSANLPWSISRKHRPIWLLRDRRFNAFPFRIALERRVARQALEQNTTEGKDVRAPVHRTAEGLLWAHVAGGACAAESR